ncbi:MAG: hypothetical protein HUJ51_04275 [Eggerthellaceae bacterium]|nr:hypothetical protein [Eggerthellaceae bacterium]
MIPKDAGTHSPIKGIGQFAFEKNGSFTIDPVKHSIVINSARKTTIALP